MPLSQYDRYFGGDAAKAMREMVKEYGADKGRQVFYARLNILRKKNRKKTGGLARKMAKPT